MKWLVRFENYVSGVLFIAGISVSLYGVFMRYVLNKPPAWVTEIFEFLMVWSIFIGFSMALRDNHHIVVDLVYDRLPYPVKRVLSVISNILGAAFCLLLTVNGIEMIQIAYEQGHVTVDVGIPLWITYLIMPVGTGLLVFRFLEKAFRAAKGDRTEIIGHLGDGSKQAHGEDSNKGGLMI
jgi:C4-dicarboxylate transporter DctQ subunit